MSKLATVHLKPGGAAVNGIELHSVSLSADANHEFFEGDMPDPAWTHTDGAGHFHAYDADGKLPTVGTRFVQVPCDGTCGGVCDDQGFTKAVHVCVLCEDPVEPRTRHGMQHIPAGPPVYTAEVTGPTSLAGFDGDTVSFVCDAGFGTGRMVVREVTMSSHFDQARAVIELRKLHHRYGTRVQQAQTEKRANLTRAIMAGAEAVRKPWEDLPEVERAAFVRDFATLAAARAITAALPLLGLDADGEILP